VVVGGDLNGLGVCRSLAAGGMPVWVVDTKRSNPALWSRYARPVLTDTLHGYGFVNFLRDLQSRIGERPFLVITDAPALLTISEHREELEALYRFRLPAHDTVLMLHDRARFQESGFGGIEYKRDARDGRFLIIEPTVGRTNWQKEVATLAGVNIPLMAYRHELGLGMVET
jgi:predicted ATP-grasp superfamily ATP-dependent carboligase